jgi:ABC-type sugar transport system substrate-binding protein
MSTPNLSWRPRLALFLRLLSSEYQDLVSEDCRRAALRHGLILNEHDGQNDATVQVRQIEDCLRAPPAVRAKALLVCPVEDSSLRSVARDAVRLGVAWVTLNRTYEYLGELRREFPRIAVFSVQPDQAQISRIQAAQVRTLLPSGGEVAYIRGPVRTVSADQREDSFRSALAGAPFQVTSVSGDWSVEGGLRAVREWLALAGRTKPEHCAIAAQNDSMAYGAYVGLREAALRAATLGKIPIFGCNGAPFGHRLVVDETLTATVVVPSPGQYAVDTLAAVLAGAPPPLADLSIAVSSFPELSALAGAESKSRIRLGHRSPLRG